MIVKLIDQNQFSKVNDKFEVSYEDRKEISDDRIRYVAICEELGIMKSKDGKFSPKSKVTIVDMAEAIFEAF